ncbi:MAG: tetratricopeptide repeat protein [Gemmataceae bacterium]
MKPTPSSPWVKDVTEATFESEVILASDQVPVIVDFWSPSCRPCLMLGPLLEKLINERQGQVLLAKVNVDEAPQLAQYFRIDSIPAVKAVYQRQLVHEFTGLIPESALREFFDQISPDGRDPEVAQAEAAEEASPEQAEAMYRDMLAQDPEKHEARVGLARVLLHLNRLDEIADLLDPVGTSGDVGAQAESLLAQVYLRQQGQGLDLEALRQRVAANPNDAQAQLELGTALASRGDYADALAALYAAAERDFKLASGKAREVMVKIFYTIGSGEPLANEYRSKLSRLLY